MCIRIIELTQHLLFEGRLSAEIPGYSHPIITLPPLEVTFTLGRGRQFPDIFSTKARGEPSAYLIPRGDTAQKWCWPQNGIFRCPCPFRLLSSLGPVLRFEATCQPGCPQACPQELSSQCLQPWGMVPYPALCIPLYTTPQGGSCALSTVRPTNLRLSFLILPAHCEALVGGGAGRG